MLVCALNLANPCFRCTCTENIKAFSCRSQRETGRPHTTTDSTWGAYVQAPRQGPGIAKKILICPDCMVTWALPMWGLSAVFHRKTLWCIIASFASYALNGPVIVDDATRWLQYESLCKFSICERHFSGPDNDLYGFEDSNLSQHLARPILAALGGKWEQLIHILLLLWTHGCTILIQNLSAPSVAILCDCDCDFLMQVKNTQ